ncbi:MAG: hypothetical protein JWN72_2649 [Thermoleophilia bacterium]|nr:hypothetical protein [Thermoleophilia bacterium]
MTNSATIASAFVVNVDSVVRELQRARRGAAAPAEATYALASLDHRAMQLLRFHHERALAQAAAAEHTAERERMHALVQRAYATA